MSDRADQHPPRDAASGDPTDAATDAQAAGEETSLEEVSSFVEETPDDASSEAPREAGVRAEDGEGGDEGSGEAHQTLELSPVTLGGDEGARAVPRARILQGRAPLQLYTYPVYMALFISGGVALDTALATREWAPLPVLLGWGLVYLWIAIYSVAWAYRRLVLQALLTTLLVAYQSLLALLCLDRAAPQLVWDSAAAKTALRPELPTLYWSAVLLMCCVVWLLVHALYLGRGYRAKEALSRAPPDEDPADASLQTPGRVA